MAELLVLTGETGFRVRAYDRGARALSGYGADLSTLSERELAAIPGVGKAIAAKVREYLDTGRVAKLEELGRRSRPACAPWSACPASARPRPAWSTSGSGSPRPRSWPRRSPPGGWPASPGWARAPRPTCAGPWSGWPSPCDGIPLAVALPVAETLRDRLAGVAGVERVEVAGSLRRMKAAVHDIDLLAAAADPAAVNRAFTELPQVAEVAALGDTKASIRTRDGLQVDLRTVQPEVWGAALQYFTGSAAHNVRIRERAVKAGLKLSEYGLFERGGELVVAEDEEVVYDRLGMAWVPPVLREDRGEVDAARRGQLPALVTLDDVGGDFHCHTDLSPDGTAPLEVMVDAARARGYRFLAITDHGERLGLGGASRSSSWPSASASGPWSERLGDITLLHGAELNIGGDGSLDYDDEFLDGFDVLVASVHDRLDQPRELLTARLVAACEHPAVNVIGHPTGRRIGSRAAGDVDLEALYRAAARTGTALEVNGSPHRLDLGDEQVRLAHQFGVMLAFGADSHGPGHLANMRFAVATAGRGWTTPDRVLNTLPMDELRRFLAKGRPGR